MDSKTPELILGWCHSFRSHGLTVDEIQDCFASLDVSGSDLPHPIQKLIIESQRELDAIRWGMCTAGQHAELERIFTELEPLLDRNDWK